MNRFREWLQHEIRVREESYLMLKNVRPYVARKILVEKTAYEHTLINYDSFNVTK